MPIIQSYVNLDDLYIKADRVIKLNDVKLTQESIKDIIYTKYGNEISIVPQCECGHYKGGYLLGKECPVCGTTVIKAFESIKPILWIENFQEDLPFVNPKFWADLNKIINSKVDGLRWLSDTSYNPQSIPPVLPGLKALIGGRSYKNVINNLDKIIAYLKHSSYYKVHNKKSKLDILHENFHKYHDKLFSTHLPLINRKLFVIEDTNKGKYTNILSGDIVDLATLAIETANNINVTPKKLQNVTAKLISKSAGLFVSYVQDLVSKKGGLIRKNIYGTRAHPAFREVVSSLPPGYRYNEIHVPWKTLCSTFRPQVLNKLIKRGYNLKQASKKVFNGVLHYDSEIDTIGKELIAESPYIGLPVLANRNPSLLQGSIQLVYITKFKPNVEESTVNISIHLAPAFNMDFDGDQLIIRECGWY